MLQLLQGTTIEIMYTKFKMNRIILIDVMKHLLQRCIETGL